MLTFARLAASMTPSKSRATAVGIERPSEKSTTDFRPGRRPSVLTMAKRAAFTVMLRKLSAVAKFAVVREKTTTRMARTPRTANE